MKKKIHLLMIEFWWKVEHLPSEHLAILGLTKRKNLEHKFVEKYKQNIYGQDL